MTPEQVQVVARAICNVVTDGDCVMNGRKCLPCNDTNCRIVPVARAAIERATIKNAGHGEEAKR